MKYNKMSASFRMDAAGIAFQRITGLCPPFAIHGEMGDERLVGRQDTYRLFMKTYGVIINDLLDAVDHLNKHNED